MELEGGAGPGAAASKYVGGEARLETGGGLACVALAANTSGAVSVAECMAALLLQRVLGMGASVKYGTGQGTLVQAAGDTAGNAAVSGEQKSSEPGHD